jgi:glutamate racemase
MFVQHVVHILKLLRHLMATQMLNITIIACNSVIVLYLLTRKRNFGVNVEISMSLCPDQLLYLCE